MVCAGLETLPDSSITTILRYPTSCYYHFWGLVMFGFFIILTLTLYNNDMKRLPKADMISSMGVSALATIFVTALGTLVGIIESDIFIYITVIGVVFIIMWIFKKD